MRAIRLPNNNLLVPATALAEGVQGDGMVEVESGTPAYESWLPYAEDDPDTAAFYERMKAHRSVLRPEPVAAK